MTPVAKWVPWLVALAVVAIGFGGFISYERALGRAEEAGKVSAHRADSLAKELVGARAKLQVDTVRLFKRVSRTDTLLNEIVRSDTLRLTDTVKVTVEVVREAVATLNACRETVRTCGEVSRMEKARADALAEQVAALKKLQPSTLGTVAKFGLAALAGFGLGHLVK